jgi:RNA polymerase sigma factor (sigma-70 family)
MRRNGRPSRGEIDPAALELIARRGSEILATARRWSSTLEDAEDAYQRGLEILLTKAPTTAEEELVPWLKTVVKHEALAVRRQRERAAPVTDDGEVAEPAAPTATHDEAERYERLRLGAEALRRLKPHEVRCLLLRAEGYSYNQICDTTGWSYTKVNRCLSEGRRAFVERVAGIEGGAECERLQPLLSALADGEAGAEELAALRPHLKNCLTCRARLREYRAAPKRVAALVPPAVVAASSGDGPGMFRSLVESVLGATHDKAAAIGERAHAAAELATGQKLAAVAASAAALAGGGAAVERVASERGGEHKAPAAEVKRVAEETAPEVVAEPSPVPPEPAPPPVAAPEPAPPSPDAANEFAPGPASPAPGAEPPWRHLPRQGQGAAAASPQGAARVPVALAAGSSAPRGRR